MKVVEELLSFGNAICVSFGETYNIVNDQPLRLCDLVNTFTDAMGKKRVGSMAPWLLKLIIGGLLVDSLLMSFRCTRT